MSLDIKKIYKLAEERPMSPLTSPYTKLQHPEVSKSLGLKQPDSGGLTGKVSRRQVWEKLVGKDRASHIIEKAKTYRDENPEFFKDIFSGKKIDKKVPVKTKKSISGGGGYYVPTIIPKLVGGNIKLSPTADLRVLLHELTHPDDKATRSYLKALFSGRLGKKNYNTAMLGNRIPAFRPEKDITTRFLSDVGATKKQWGHRIVRGLIDPVYTHNYDSRKYRTYSLGAETAPVINELRADLETNNVDTTDTLKLMSALKNLKKYKGGRIDQFRKAIQDLQKKGEKEWANSVLKSLV